MVVESNNARNVSGCSVWFSCGMSFSEIGDKFRNCSGLSACLVSTFNPLNGLRPVSVIGELGTL